VLRFNTGSVIDAPGFRKIDLAVEFPTHTFTTLPVEDWIITSLISTRFVLSGIALELAETVPGNNVLLPTVLEYKLITPLFEIKKEAVRLL
jgi:hypothetical protein